MSTAVARYRVSPVNDLDDLVDDLVVDSGVGGLAGITTVLL
jgi:hypothetical protein